MFKFSSIHALLIVAGLCGFAMADDQPPVPTDVPAAIVASKDVTGTGKKSDPFVFDTSTKCLLRFSGKADGVQWDTDDCPASFEVIEGKYGAFDLSSPGLYQTAVHGGSVYSKVWFEIKGPNSPPQPVNQLAAKLKAALVGPDARTDAARLEGMVSAIADDLEAGRFKTFADLGTAWKRGQEKIQWPAGKYPAMPDIIRLAIPPADETTPLDATNTPAYVANLRTIEKTARAITNG